MIGPNHTHAERETAGGSRTAIPVDVTRGMFLAALATFDGGMTAESGELHLFTRDQDTARAWREGRDLVIGALGFAVSVRAGRARSAQYGPPYVEVGGIKART